MDKPVFVDFETKVCADYLNTVANAVWDALGQPLTPSDVRVFIGAIGEAPQDGVSYVRRNASWVNVASGLLHNDLGGRSANDTHPTAAITGLDNALTALADYDAAQDARIDTNEASIQGVQDNLSLHEADFTNPHQVTAAQAGADPAGSADAVQGNLNDHEADFTNPHQVTAAQAGADPVGSADAVQSNLDDHEADFTNPHQVTAAQAGAEPGLGNPAEDGFVLSSTIAGVRSWIEAGGTGGGLTVSDTAPLDPEPGDMWMDSSQSTLPTYVWYDDGDSTQWVLQSDPFGALAGAVVTSPPAGLSQMIKATDPGDRPLSIQGAPGQTNNLFAIFDGDGTTAMRVSPNGRLISDIYGCSFTVGPEYSATQAFNFRTKAGSLVPYGMRIQNEEPAIIPLVLKAALAQIADMQQWRDNADAVLARMTPAGQLQSVPRGCFVVRNTNQNIPNAATTSVIFNSATYDSEGIWDGNQTFTFPADAKWARITVQVEWTGNVTSYRQVLLAWSNNQTGYTNHADAREGRSAGATRQGFCTGVVPVVGGSGISVSVIQGSGGTLALQAAMINVEILG
jgi:hypothetical protein